MCGTGHVGRVDEDRVGTGLPGDDRGSGSRADALDQREHGQAARDLPGSAVLHTWTTHNGHRTRLRSHHVGDWRGDDWLVWHRDALLRDPEGASRFAEQEGRE